MRMDWASIIADDTDVFAGRVVELRGFFVPLPGADYGVLVAEPGCCGAHVPMRPQSSVEVFLAEPAGDAPPRMLTARGRWQRRTGGGFRFALQEAQLVEDTVQAPRRRLFVGAAAAGLVACSAGPFGGYRPASDTAGASPRRPAGWSSSAPCIDVHSHAGRVILSRQESAARQADLARQRPFLPLAAPMRAGGMNVVCLAMVADTTATHVRADGRGFEPWRDPEPGEMYAHSKLAFARCAALIEAQGLHVIEDAAALRVAPSRGPSVIVACEGADFLEGRLDRVDEAWRVHRLRHMQLTHYRVNELGDIQTEALVHGGLTDFGAAVIERCNGLGIVVDVAHGPYALVQRAARVTTRPLVLSHTSLTARPGPRSRQISAAHARLVAGTGGVVGVWPNGAVYASLEAMAHGARRLADVIGADHVALGSDMLGFIEPPVLRSYRQVPDYADALVGAGFTVGEVEKILGANYQRVFEAALAGTGTRAASRA